MTEKLLGQLRPTGTGAEVVYSVPSDTTAIVKTIVVSNVGSGSIKYSIFVSEATTYNESTAISFDISLATEKTNFIQTYIATTGNIAFKTDTANDATITLFGAEI